MRLKPAHRLALALLATAAVAQAQVQAAPQNVVNLNAEASVELPQDLLAILQAMKAAGALRAELEII